jgi:F0F1-type ATP synthase epsilon subunit
MADQKIFRLIVRTPDEEICVQDVHSLKVTTELGEMVVYPGHASLSGSILFSKMTVKGDGFEDHYVVRRGLIFVSMEENKVTVMAYSIKKTDSVDYKTLSEYLEHVRSELAKGHENLNTFQVTYLENEMIAVQKELETEEGK